MHSSGSITLCIIYEAVQRGNLNIPFEFSSEYKLRTTTSPFSLPPTSLYHPSCLQELTLLSLPDCSRSGGFTLDAPTSLSPGRQESHLLYLQSVFIVFVLLLLKLPHGMHRSLRITGSSWVWSYDSC